MPRTPATLKVLRRSGRRTSAPSLPGSSPKQMAPPKIKAPALPRIRSMGTFKRPEGLLVDNPQALQNDLAAMGWNSLHRKYLNMLIEPEVDSSGALREGTYAQALVEKQKKLDVFLKKQTRRCGVAKKAGNSPKKNGKTQVYLGNPSTSKWVLFDPFRGYPPTLPTEPPASYERVSEYKPGNAKILAYNTDSFAVQLRKTPVVFEGQEVQYLKQGPRLTKITPKIIAAKTKAKSKEKGKATVSPKADSVVEMGA